MVITQAAGSIRYDVETETDLLIRLRNNVVRLYDLPAEFWEPILGAELHFHLGHFSSSSGTNLVESMRAAVARLVLQARPRPRPTVLDVGCGWGAPAFQLAALWDASVRGLTVSPMQVDYVRGRASSSGAPVTALVYDAEVRSFADLGTYDVALVYESIDHIWWRDRLISRLRNAVRVGGWLLIAAHCRASHVPRHALLNEFLGIPPLDTAAEIEAMVASSGWRIVSLEDCTDLTGPVWDRWITNTHRHGGGPFAAQAAALRHALIATRDLYSGGRSSRFKSAPLRSEG